MANPKADKARIVFGVGIGVALTVVVVFIAYIVQRNAYFTEFENENYYLYGLLQEARADGHVSEESIISMARELGMIFPNEMEIDGDLVDDPADEQTEDGDTEETDGYYDEEPVEPAEPVANQPVAGHVWVNIPWGAYGHYIAVILQHHGVVDSAVAFENFLIAGGYSVSLMAGSFLLPIGGDFNEIVQIISIGNQ